MIFFTGDIHGNVNGVADFINKVHPTMEDVIVLLGDVGANYYNGRKDYLMKQWLNDSGTRFLCIHGNHEMRPVNISGYIETEWCGGKGWLQPEYPNLIFAKDGEIYTMNGLRYLVIGGAYSVDKYYRLSRGWSWWPDEQPSDETKRQVEALLARRGWQMPVVLTHTCPLRYKPLEALKPDLDQSTVDCTTELWMDAIESRLRYDHWFCGHFHTDKQIDNLQILFQTFVPFPSEG